MNAWEASQSRDRPRDGWRRNTGSKGVLRRRGWRTLVGDVMEALAPISPESDASDEEEA
jgi:hypothetical protein